MSSLSQFRVAVATTATAALLPSLAHAAPLTPGGIFADAMPLVQTVILGLLVATIAAIAVCVLRLATGGRSAAGTTFLSSLRLGGPLVGLFGAGLTTLSLCVGLANSPAGVPVKVLAPGFAEAMLLLVLGAGTGAVAVIAHWVVKARDGRGAAA